MELNVEETAVKFLSSEDLRAGRGSFYNVQGMHKSTLYLRFSASGIPLPHTSSAPDHTIPPFSPPPEPVREALISLFEIVRAQQDEISMLKGSLVEQSERLEHRITETR